MKKFVGLAIAAIIFFALTAVCYAENGFSLSFNGNSYTIEAASSKDSGLPFSVTSEDDATVLTDADSGLKVIVKYDVLDDNFFLKLREYYNDNKSSNDDLFNKYIELQKTYVATLNNYFNTAFLYGEAGDPDKESNMKFFFTGDSKLFGQDSYVHLYNTERTDKLDYTEKANLDMIIPVPSEYALISIRAELDNEKLNSDTVIKIEQMLSCLRFGDLPPQLNAPNMLSDKKLLEKVNAGIYPARSRQQSTTFQQASTGTITLRDDDAGFCISVPDSYMPYMQNSIGGKELFHSYKITPSQIFSVTSEILASEAGSPKQNNDKIKDSIKEKIAFIKNLYKSTIKDMEEGNTTINERDYTYFKYDIEENGSTTHIIDYFTISGTALYTMELRTRFEEPSEALLNEFHNILATFQSDFGSASSVTATTILKSTNADTVNFTSATEGYGFDYPSGWKLSDISKNISFDDYKLILPELSGQLEIYVSEGELNPGLKTEDIPACLSGQNAEQLGRYIKKYTPPYKGLTSKLLNVRWTKSDNTISIYRLINYIDQNGRSKLSYTVDIIRGQRIYSMFVTLGENRALDGKMSNSSINNTLNALVSSFRIVNTPESDALKAKGELRNGKVLFVEEFLRKNVDLDLVVTSVSDYNSDGSFYATADNSDKSGYYRVKLDYQSKKLSIVDSTLKNIILNTELKKLSQHFDKPQISDISIDDKDMTITLVTTYLKGAAPFTATYATHVDLSDDGVSWNTVRQDQAADLRKDCEIYLDWMFGVDTKLCFEKNNEFSNIASYSQDGIKYQFIVYTELKNTAGYSIFSVDPNNDSLTLILYKPLSELIDDIILKYSLNNNDCKIKGYSLDENRFNITLEIEKHTGGSSETFKQTYNIRYNLELNTLEY